MFRITLHLVASFQKADGATALYEHFDLYDYVPPEMDDTNGAVEVVTGASTVMHVPKLFTIGTCSQKDIASHVDMLAKFASGTSGFTSDVADNFERMFILMTITTLGFGDIVPITTKARRLVTIEAISGVVLIGLFLNSLSRDARKRSWPTDGIV
jgi:hypothetical protein